MYEENNLKILRQSTSETEPQPIPGDPPVYYTQVWLNSTFGTNASWVQLAEDGKTGWNTIYGLIRGLQIYLGVGADGDFGNGTKSAYMNKFSSTNGELRPVNNDYDIIYGIISGALWCKGYYGSFSQTINCNFDERTSVSICQLKKDAGLDYSNDYVNVLLMKALLSMDQFVLLENYGGNSNIQTIQRYLNANYGQYVGIIPCDGLYQREMNKALIKVLQVVEGFSGNDVDGIFGNGTRDALPMLSIDSADSEAIRLFHFCLTCNGFYVSGTSYTNATTVKVKLFQKKHLIPQTGRGDRNTWMALLLSKGNPDRSAVGCDCATILDAEKAAALYNAGYRYVGRYVSGTVGSGSNEHTKALTKTEMTAIFNAGLSLFAIYQEGGVYLERYTYEKGKIDAEKAIAAAISLDIPAREYIYFAVDYDVMDGYIPGYVKEYFIGINEVMSNNGNIYHVGIYGARNVCSRICSEFGLASSSFISDMSTGYSGNMGYPLPENWAFDQFNERTFSSGTVSFPIDKDAVSGRYMGFNQFGHSDEDVPPSDNTPDPLEIAYEMVKDTYKALTQNPLNIGGQTAVDWSDLNFEMSLNGITIKISVMHSYLFSLNNESTNFVTGTIENGEISGINFEAVQHLFGQVDTNVQAELDLDLGLSVSAEMVQSVEHGKFSYGVKITNAQQLTVYTITEAYLDPNDPVNTSVSVKVEITIDDDNQIVSSARESIMETVKDAEPVILVAVILVGIAVGAYVGIPATLAAILEALASLLGALPAILTAA